MEQVTKNKIESSPIEYSKLIKTIAVASNETRAIDETLRCFGFL